MPAHLSLQSSDATPVASPVRKTASTYSTKRPSVLQTLSRGKLATLLLVITVLATASIGLYVMQQTKQNALRNRRAALKGIYFMYYELADKQSGRYTPHITLELFTAELKKLPTIGGQTADEILRHLTLRVPTGILGTDGGLISQDTVLAYESAAIADRGYLVCMDGDIQEVSSEDLPAVIANSDADLKRIIPSLFFSN